MKKTTPAGGIAAFALALAASQAAAGRPGDAPGNTATDEQIQITATRFGERIQEVPGSISAVSGDELRARGALDLRSALALMAGISVAPGGDAGPAGATPGLLGVREIDDLLLLIDGIPAGGAYTPQVEAVSLVNVERIEVLRGAAPVYYGTTAFAGTINIIHYAAGQADSGFTLRAGSRRSVGASGAVVLSTGAVRQTLSGEVSDDKVADRRAGYQRAQGTWRLGTEVAGGDLRADVHLLSLRQKPNSPSPFDDSIGQFTPQLPVDFNQNPADAKLDTNRYQLTLAYERPLAFGRWGSTLSYSETRTDSIRGFIDMGDSPPPWPAGSSVDLEAFSQSRRLKDLFIDSHLTSKPLPGLDLTAGVNLLLGRATAHSLRYAHTLLADGVAQLPNLQAVASKGTVDLTDERRFIGLYAQSRFKLGEDASLLAGLRWNSTHETRNQTRVNRAGVVTLLPGTQDVQRLSGSLGGQWKAWQATSGPVDSLTLHASVGNTFQPAQIDFNPNPETQPEGGGLLKAETQNSLVFGIKTDLWKGLAEIDIDGFVVDFNHQPIEVLNAAGSPVLRAGGRQRYTGLEVEGLVLPAAGWTIRTHLAWTAAKYRDFFTLVDGAPTQLSGKQQVLTPTWRAGAGVVLAPERGWRGSLTTAWTGKHSLNRMNTAQAPAYAVVDASLGYRFDVCTLQLAAANLGNRRDATQQSELGEDQFYRLPARRVDISLTVPFR